MQYKSLIYWFFEIMGQYLCPKKPFMGIYIGIIVGLKETVLCQIKC